LSDVAETIGLMSETNPQTNPHLSAPEALDLSELEDPVAAVLAAELTSCFVQLCLCSAEPIVAKLAGQEVMLRKPGGIDLSKRVFAQQLYRRIDTDVFQLLRSCVPLEHAEFALSRIEVALREQFADIVATAASHVLSDDREVALQMAAVATTMAAREVRAEVMAIIAATRQSDEEV
jgi:hypothetical protein